MKLLLPLIIALFGLFGGAAAGWILRPAPADPCAVPAAHAESGHATEETGEGQGDEAQAATHDGAEEAPDCDPHVEEPKVSHSGPTAESAFFEFKRQFIVPVVEKGGRETLMVLTLTLETAPGEADEVEAREPKVRDAILRVLFEHAATGGFDGDYTAAAVMRDLRRNMSDAARRIAGPSVRDVLISDIVRQDR